MNGKNVSKDYRKSTGNARNLSSGKGVWGGQEL
jgi:hypothetical protein